MLKFQTGDSVVLVINAQTLTARVRLASASGRSLMLEFEDEALRLPNGGIVAEMLPVMLTDAGGWIEILTRSPLELRPQEPS